MQDKLIVCKIEPFDLNQTIYLLDRTEAEPSLTTLGSFSLEELPRATMTFAHEKDIHKIGIFSKFADAKMATVLKENILTTYENYYANLGELDIVFMNE